ncbi:nuclear transport factor 2 family protein [Streptomyces sp. NPDC035033]|uniref:nuclear transport factor 2 family protein n=1 Tax=Streptomyces sp. NPDC035033 TaxID=3155368 RepID=UPI0033FB0E88
MNDGDGLEIASLLNRYILGLDDEDVVLDEKWACGIFTRDAVVTFPVGESRGIEEIVQDHRRMLAAWERTQHMHSPADVVVAGDSARLVAHVVATHVHRTGSPPHAPTADPPTFSAGTFVSAGVRRTADGWRFTSLGFRLRWTRGTPPHARG